VSNALLSFIPSLNYERALQDVVVPQLPCLGRVSLLCSSSPPRSTGFPSSPAKYDVPPITQARSAESEVPSLFFLPEEGNLAPSPLWDCTRHYFRTAVLLLGNLYSNFPSCDLELAGLSASPYCVLLLVEVLGRFATLL